MRDYDSQPTECVCIDHGTSMEDGDHSGCTIELLTCPLHLNAPTDPSSDQANEPQTEEDWVPIMAPLDLEEMFNAWINDSEPNIGWCLICNRPIRSENDLIPESNVHNCEAARELEPKLAAPSQSSQHSDHGASDVENIGTTLDDGLTDPEP